MVLRHGIAKCRWYWQMALIDQLTVEVQVALRWDVCHLGCKAAWKRKWQAKCKVINIDKNQETQTEKTNNLCKNQVWLIRRSMIEITTQQWMPHIADTVAASSHSRSSRIAAKKHARAADLFLPHRQWSRTRCELNARTRLSLSKVHNAETFKIPATEWCYWNNMIH